MSSAKEIEYYFNGAIEALKRAEREMIRAGFCFRRSSEVVNRLKAEFETKRKQAHERGIITT